MIRNEILAELDFLAEQGALRYKGVRYLLIRPETLASLQIALEAQIGRVEAAEAFYHGGFTGGRLSGLRYKEAMGLSDREAVEFMCQMGSQIGWGRFRPVDIDTQGRRLVVEVEASPFAQAYDRPTDQGVCHLTRGVLAGLGKGLFGSDVDSHEPRCLARGDARCRFEVQAP